MLKEKKGTIILLVLITLGIFLKVLIGYSEYIIPSDVYTQVYPWINENLNIASNIELPLWSDSMFGGYPIFQDPQHSVFYIFHYILVFFKNTDVLLYAIQFILIIQFLIISISTYLIGIELNMSNKAALFTSVTFAFSGYTLSHIQHFSSIEVLMYMPLILLYMLRYYKTAKKSNLILIAICLALSIFAGSVQVIIYNTFFIFLINIYLALKNRDYKKGLYVIFYIILGIIIAGIQIIPTMELSYNSLRSELTYELFSKNSNNFKNLLTMLFPFIYNSEFILSYSTPINSLYYIGIVPIIFLILSILNMDKKNIKIWSMVFIFYLLSLGENTFIHKIIYEIPVFNKFQRSVNWWFYVQFLISLLIGYNFDKLLNNKNKKRNYFSIIIFMFIVIWGYIYIINKNIINDLNIFIILNVVICFINLIIFILFFKQKISQELFEKTILVVLIMDILLNSYNNSNLVEKLNTNMSVFSKNIFDFSSEDVEFIKNNLKNEERIFVKEINNSGGVLNESTLVGYNPLIIRKYSEFINMFETCLDYRVVDVNNFNTNLLDIFSVKYIVLNEYVENIDNNENYKLIKQKDNTYLYENIDFVSRFYFTEKTIKKDKDSILISVADQNYNPYKEVYGERLNNKEYKISKDAKIDILEKDNNYIKLKINNDYASYIGTTEIMYDGWIAKVNGKERKIDNINYIFKGIELEEGNNIVEFYYKPISLKYGIIISGIGIVILIFNVIFYRKNINKVKEL